MSLSIGVIREKRRNSIARCPFYYRRKAFFLQGKYLYKITYNR
jgi:hypothetical protein